MEMKFLKKSRKCLSVELFLEDVHTLTRMPTLKEIRQVIAIYVQERCLHPLMAKYLRIVIQQGKSEQQLDGMSKEELWGLVNYFASDLQKHMLEIGALSPDAR
jgi:hypothetical protein